MFTIYVQVNDGDGKRIDIIRIDIGTFFYLWPTCKSRYYVALMCVNMLRITLSARLQATPTVFGVRLILLVVMKVQVFFSYDPVLVSPGC